MPGSITFAFQGALGAFSHQAGKEYSAAAALRPVEFLPCNSFAEVFESVNSGKARYGVLPLENSSIGSITANFDLLWANEVFIIGEVLLPVRHQLIGLPGSEVSKIREVYSHPAALDQCKNFFQRTPNARPVAHFDTSGSVLLVKESNNSLMAAIAGEYAAQEYGLEILQRNIEDHSGNSTRFGVVQLEAPNNGLAFPAKSSCAVELSHKPGALAKLLTAVSDLDVNLTKVESRPIPEQPWHYRFFIDLELADRAQYDKVQQLLSDNSDVYKLLGLYRPWSAFRGEG